MIPEVFVRRAKRLLAEAKGDLSFHILEGRCQNFEDYRFTIGQVKAYKHLEVLLDEAIAESEEDNDE
ncbi:MAG TPA: hypothetical protein VFI27_04095 [candidate division Zixibacteria bacterium]|nr:hypothetical protein [candidate division Zixibacteria bacterium]HUU81186.1 hypothetical protein [Acidobacteriota bacterium]